MKKHIAFMVSCIMLAVCFSFPAFATTPTGRRREASYDYGDVSLHVSVDAGASVTYNNDVCHYDHRFTVTLTNKTNTFQIADQNILGFKLYTGRKDYFDNTFVGSSGTTQSNASWGAEVTSYSDNMTVPDIKFYTSASSGWEGSVYIKFNDSDLLVLNPNETRTYNFTIDFIASQTVSAMPINGNYVYGYFTYLSNSSISIFNKPNTFTSNTVEDFISNNSFPNSVIPWIMANYEVLSKEYPDISNFVGSSGNIYTQVYQYGLPFSGNIRILSLPSKLVDYDFEINPSSSQGGYNAVFAVPVYIINSFCNTTSDTYSTGNYFINADYNVPSVNGYSLIGRDIEFITQDQIFAYNISANQINYRLDNIVDGKHIFEKGKTQVNIIKLTLYYGVGNYDSNLETVVGPSVNVTISNYTKPSVSIYSQSIFGSIGKNFADLRDRIQQLIDGNTSANQDISDDSGTVSDTESQIHAQEQQWYSDNETAIEATGLSNFEFSSGELDGLTQLRLQFAQVWGALGDWTLVYIFVLSLSLATFILRHRPTTKAQQRMADSAKYRQDVRNRWAVQDARASNNSNGFSDEIWRRAGYR